MARQIPRIANNKVAINNIPWSQKKVSDQRDLSAEQEEEMRKNKKVRYVIFLEIVVDKGGIKLPSGRAWNEPITPTPILGLLETLLGPQYSLFISA